MAKINIIAAVADNLALGNEGKLLWHIAEDMKFFKSVTMGSPVLMGKKTFKSLDKPLYGRQNVVITHDPTAVFPRGVIAVGSVEEAVNIECEDGVFVIGGGEIYRQTMPLADRLFITHVHTIPAEADTFFPEIDPEIWEPVSGGGPQHDDESGLDFEFKIYERKAGKHDAQVNEEKDSAEAE